MPLTNEKLPNDVLAAIEDVNVAQKIKNIGIKYQLHLDQVGVLSTEIDSVMRGVVHPDEFVARIEEALGISTETAIDIATDVNIEIFLSIRQSLMSMHEAEEAAEDVTAPVSAPAPIPAQPPAPQKQAQEELTSSREDILAGIENPEPAIHPISAVDQTIPGPAMRTEVTPADKVAATSFINGKLTETVTRPPQKAIFKEKKAPEKPNTYKADPYREPIM